MSRKCTRYLPIRRPAPRARRQQTSALFCEPRCMAADLLPELALIPSGEFLMGSDDADDDERPAHRVHLDDFLMAVHPVTHAEYARFVRETGHRAPAIYELPLVVTAGGRDREQNVPFGRSALRVGWFGSAPGSARSSGHARALGRRDRVLRLALGRDQPQGAAPDRGGMGEGRSRRSRRQTVSVGRSARSQHGEFPDGPVAQDDATARRSAAPIRRTATASSTWPGTSGSGCTTGIPRSTTRGRRIDRRPARGRGRCGSCAAAAGSWPTCACSPAAIATRCRLIHTRTGLVSGSSVRPSGPRP